MAKRDEATKGYSSALRDQGKEATRASILDALVRVVLDEGVHRFSVATVAARAGIAHRTVYRHFASREELLEALAEDIDASGPPDVHESQRNRPLLEQARVGVTWLFEALESIRERATAEVIIGVALRHNTRGKMRRWDQIRAEVRERFPALSAEEQLAGAAVVRALSSSFLWFHLCVQLGVPADVAAKGVARAVELVLEDLARRNEEQDRALKGAKRKRGKP